MKRERADREAYSPPKVKAMPEFAKLAELEPGLEIQQNALDESLMQQPDLYYQVSKELAILSSRRDAAKQNVQEVEASVDGEIREKAAKRDEKLTVQEVEARKRVHPKVQQALRDFQNLNSAVNQFAALKEAYQQRSFALKSLVELHVSNYFETGSVTASAGREKDVRADRVRKRMNEQRRNRE